VVVVRFHELQHLITRCYAVAEVLAVLRFILQTHDPNTLASGTAVLLHDTGLECDPLREIALHVLCGVEDRHEEEEAQRAPLAHGDTRGVLLGGLSRAALTLLGGQPCLELFEPLLGGSQSESDNELVQIKKGDTGIIDATTPGKGQCTERLWESADEMNW